MKLQLVNHDEKYALEQSLLALFPDERPVYGTATPEDARRAVVTMTEDAEQVTFVTELWFDGKTARYPYSYPLSGDAYEREGQRRHALGVPHDHLTLGRQGETVVVVIEYLHVPVFFQLPYVLAHRRLAQPQLKGGPGKAAGLHHLEQ